MEFPSLFKIGGCKREKKSCVNLYNCSTEFFTLTKSGINFVEVLFFWRHRPFLRLILVSVLKKDLINLLDIFVLWTFSKPQYYQIPMAWLGFSNFRLSKTLRLEFTFFILLIVSLEWHTFLEKCLISGTYYNLYKDEGFTTIMVTRPQLPRKCIIERAQRPAHLSWYPIKYKQTRTLVRICHSFLRT